MGCRLPGRRRSTRRAFWELLANGVDAIGEIPAERWSMDELYDPTPTCPGGSCRVPAASSTTPDQFDPQFFGISPREAVTMDPQQRLLLEVSWEALEAAGIAPASLVGTATGVYVGIGIYDYGHVTREAMESGGIPIDAYVGTGNSASVAAGRISFALGLQRPGDVRRHGLLLVARVRPPRLPGPARRRGRCGHRRRRQPDVHPRHAHLHVAAARPQPDGSLPDLRRIRGRLRPQRGRRRWSSSSGCPTHGPTATRSCAVIRGSAVNHDGRSSGLTVPNGAAQQAVIRAALDDARLDPRDVEFVETHGTGTPLGDPIEVRALDAVYGTDRDEPLRIGSVKTNIGHLESASGIAGLLKLVLPLEHEHIPPHLHLTEPTPHLDWDELAVEVPTAGRPWPAATRPRIGGINSFGLSGTNSHILISEARRRAPRDRRRTSRTSEPCRRSRCRPARAAGSRAGRGDRAAAVRARCAGRW